MGDKKYKVISENLANKSFTVELETENMHFALKRLNEIADTYKQLIKDGIYKVYMAVEFQ